MQNFISGISWKENRIFLVTVFLLLFGAIVLLASSNVPKQISGEALYDFHYADRYPAHSSWIEYYFQRVRARPMAAVYFSGLYELTGYNPPLLYFASIFLVIGIAGGLSFLFKQLRVPDWILGISVLILALLPLNITGIFALKKAYHLFAWFALVLALILIFRWIKTRRIVWLILGALSYLAGLFAYEAILLLLPAAILFGNEYVKTWKDFWRILITLMGITVIGILSVFLLEYVKSGRSVLNFYGTSGIEEWLDRVRLVVIEFPKAIWNGGLFSLYYSPPSWVIGVTQLLMIITLTACAAGLALTILRNRSLWQNSAIALTLLGLLFGVAGYLPFTLANQPPDNDGLVGAAIGFVMLNVAAILFLAQWGQKRIGQVFIVVFAVFWVACGLASYAAALQTTAVTDQRITNFVVSLKEKVPAVKEGTEFIFVQAGLGRTGCIGAMNMIFAREELHCLHFFDNDTQETYTRNMDDLVDDRGQIYQLSFIVLTMDEAGNAIVLDQVTQEGFPLLPINWKSPEPIKTDYGLILEETETGFETPIYLYSLGIK